MEIVKHGMNHGEISLETYSTVWEECYKEVLFIPAVNKYGRSSMASSKDRLESLEKKLQVCTFCLHIYLCCIFYLSPCKGYVRNTL